MRTAEKKFKESLHALMDAYPDRYKEIILGLYGPITGAAILSKDLKIKMISRQSLWMWEKKLREAYPEIFDAELCPGPKAPA